MVCPWFVHGLSTERMSINGPCNAINVDCAEANNFMAGECQGKGKRRQGEQTNIKQHWNLFSFGFFVPACFRVFVSLSSRFFVSSFLPSFLPRFLASFLPSLLPSSHR